jgi:hypothetical protein
MNKLMQELQRLYFHPEQKTLVGESSAPALEAGSDQAGRRISDKFTDPKSFLLAVMNDPSATLVQRIKAAKALLPC